MATTVTTMPAAMARTATKTDVPLRPGERTGPGGHRLPGLRAYTGLLPILIPRIVQARRSLWRWRRRRSCHDRQPRGNERGFALLIVLLTLGFLALLGTQFGAEGRNAMALARNQRAEAVVEAATAGAVQDQVFALLAAGDAARLDTGVIRRIRIGSTAIALRVANEGDRLNLNLAQAPQMSALLRQVGASPQQAAAIAAAVLDWRTGGTIPRPGGAKAPQYLAAGLPYASPDAPFRSVGELGQILGVTPALLQALRPHVTVFTSFGPLGQSADPVVARALADAAPPGSRPRTGDLGALAVARIIATGAGPDGTTVTLRAVVRLNGTQHGAPFELLSWRRIYGS